MIVKSEKTIIRIERIKGAVNEDFNSFKWLLKARQSDNEDWKPIFSKVFADKDWIVCTDARRMHMIKNVFDINSGLYDVLVNDNKKIVLSASDCLDKFPDYNQVFKKDFVLTEILNTPNGLTSANIARMYMNFYNKINDKKSGLAFDMDFMKQSFKISTYMSVLVKIDKGIYSGTEPIRIQDSQLNHVAIVMPILLKENENK